MQNRKGDQLTSEGRVGELEEWAFLVQIRVVRIGTKSRRREVH